MYMFLKKFFVGCGARQSQKMFPKNAKWKILRFKRKSLA